MGLNLLLSAISGVEDPYDRFVKLGKRAVFNDINNKVYDINIRKYSVLLEKPLNYFLSKEYVLKIRNKYSPVLFSQKSYDYTINHYIENMDDRNSLSDLVLSLLIEENNRYYKNKALKKKTIVFFKNHLDVLHDFVELKIHFPFIYIFDNNWYIPINIIFRRAILAMFIGIFLQLIIQDRSITEPV